VDKVQKSDKTTEERYAELIASINPKCVYGFGQQNEGNGIIKTVIWADLNKPT
jgi:hypothetical protein